MNGRAWPHGVRRRAWTVMRALQEQGRRFTAASIATEIRAPVPRVASFMRLGLQRGFVVALPDQAEQGGALQLAADAGFAVMPLQLAADAPHRAPRPELTRRDDGADRTSLTERAWRTILSTCAPFSSRAVIDATPGVSRDTMRTLMPILLTTGFVEIAGERHGGRGRLYRLVERGGVKPPVRRDDGTIVDPNDGRCWSAAGERLPNVEVDPQPLSQRAWLAMRAISGAFTVADVALLAEISPRLALALITTLERIGYATCVEQARGSRPGKYRLIVRSGPRVPRRLSTGGWIDPNNGRRWNGEGVELPAPKRGRRT